MLSVVADVPWSVSVCLLCVCVLDTTVNTTKTAEAIKVPFGMWTRVGPKDDALGRGQDAPEDSDD